ncbi:MAG: hypothetical protein H7Y88_02085 [Phycisphaerales bacterium]|nr:hypothetical protein [Phycisphaerales bacterium]
MTDNRGSWAPQAPKTGRDSEIWLENSQTITGGTFRLVPFSRIDFLSPDGLPQQVTTLSATTVIEGAGIVTPTFGAASRILANNGVIRANIAGQELRVSGIENHGLVEVTEGANLWAGGLTNEGHINIDGGTLTLAGGLIFGSNSTFSRNGGTVLLRGTVENAGRTLVLDRTTGTWNAEDARINGGTIEFHDGARLIAPQNNRSITLDGVAVDGSWDADTFPRLDVYNGLTLLQPSVTREKGIRFLGVGPHEFSRDLRVDSHGPFNSTHSILTLNGLGTIEITDGSAIRGGRARLGGTESGPGVGTLINEGLISADQLDQQINIHSREFVNNGVIEALNGGYFSISGNTAPGWDAAWENNGVLRVGAGSRLELGGRVRTADLGTIENLGGDVWFTRSLDNSGAVLDTGTIQNVRLTQYGAIKGGTVDATTQPLYVSGSGFLDGLTLNGTVAVENGQVNFRNGVVLNGTVNLGGANSSALSLLVSDANLNSTLSAGTIHFDPSSAGDHTINGGFFTSNITLGAGVVVHGGRGAIFTSSSGSVTNAGLISADVPGETISIYTTRFSNQGTVQAINGGMIMYIPPRAGELDSPTLAPLFSNECAIVLDQGGAFSFTGDFVQLPWGRLSLVLGRGPETVARVAVTGEASLGGTLEVLLPESGSALGWYQLLSFSTRHGQFDTILLPELAEGFSWDLSRLHTEGGIALVPAPSALALLAPVGLAALRRRRSQSSSSTSESL